MAFLSEFFIHASFVKLDSWLSFILSELGASPLSASISLIEKKWKKEMSQMFSSSVSFYLTVILINE